jgi:hypothetical protein
MPRFKLRRPTLTQCIFGLWMGAVVVFMPVAYRRLTHGVWDPTVNWWLLIAVWLAGSAAFAIASGSLLRGARASATKPD